MTLVFYLCERVLPGYAFESRQIPFDENNTMQIQEKKHHKNKVQREN